MYHPSVATTGGSALCLFLFLFLLLIPSPTSAARCHVDDESGLLSFKSGIKSDPSGMLSDWKNTTNCCTWSGITCLSGDRVTSLWLSGQPENFTTSLSGTISPSLSKLSHLSGIYLMDLKFLTGPFPDFLLSLPKFQFIYLQNSQLSGPLPPDIGSHLRQLDVLNLEDNRFSGPIPTSIGELTQLTRLQLGGNRFTGTIPAVIRNLRNLLFLELDRNQLVGTIPDLFSSMTNLTEINLSNNNFTGKFPNSISNLFPTLRYLELGHNSLTGQIPDFLRNFRRLDTLDLSWNQFSGTVPKSLANLTKIFNLDLSHNRLIDPFPQLYVKGIESLDLSYNKFKLGKIPQWVTTSPIIYSLKLAGCGIKMKLDDWNPTETYFYDYIDLSDNEISGSPIQLLNRTEFLIGFNAAKNKLKFNFESLKFAKTLKQLDLSNNLIFGKVPAAVSGVRELNVSYNHLCGRLPATKFPASVFAGNDCLCGAPLPPCKG